MALLFSFSGSARAAAAEPELQVDGIVPHSRPQAGKHQSRNERGEQRHAQRAAGASARSAGVPGTTAPSSPCVRTPIGRMANSTVHQMTT